MWKHALRYEYSWRLLGGLPASTARALFPKESRLATLTKGSSDA